jgi:hypothetical protein
MLVCEFLCNPDDSYSFEAGSVGEELAEVSVVGTLELVLN